MTDRIKCKFCNWTTAKAFTAKDGKFKGPEKAQQRLLNHVFDCHPAEMAEVDAALEREFEGKGE